MSIFKRYATVAYDRQNFSILSVESVSPPEPVTYDPGDFRAIYSRALIPSANKTSDDTTAVEALLFQMGWLLRLYQDDYSDDKETPLTYLQGFLTIPVQFYTAAFEYANATYARNAITLEGSYLSPRISRPRYLELQSNSVCRQKTGHSGYFVELWACRFCGVQSFSCGF